MQVHVVEYSSEDANINIINGLYIDSRTIISENINFREKGPMGGALYVRLKQGNDSIFEESIYYCAL